MSSRFGSSLHQRDARSALFSNYDRASSQSPSARSAHSHLHGGSGTTSTPGGYGAPGSSHQQYHHSSSPYSNGGSGIEPERPSSTPGGGAGGAGGSAFGAYPSRAGAGFGSSQLGMGGPGAAGPGGSGYFRSSTPGGSGKDGYSAAMLEELESQNSEHITGLTSKVKMLKDLTVQIGTEIRDSSALAEKMNDQFSNSSVRLRGTMNRMLRMAERTGVGWKAWLGFFAAVTLLFWYVWLF